MSISEQSKSLRVIAWIAACFLFTGCEVRDGQVYSCGSQTAPTIAEEAMWGDRVFFGYNSSVLLWEGQQTLQAQAKRFEKYPDLKLVIEGHTDERGTREYNLALGERRANAVFNYLSSLGIGTERMSIISYGKERPSEEGASEEIMAKNRRAVTVESY